MNPQLRKAIDLLRPEAREAVQMAKQDATTKDGYQVIYHMVSQLPKAYAKVFLLACIIEGYPRETALEIATLIQV